MFTSLTLLMIGALKVATPSAVAAAFDLEVEPRELTLLCQHVENLEHLAGWEILWRFW